MPQPSPKSTVESGRLSGQHLAEHAVGIGFLTLGVFVVAQSFGLGLFTRLGPGAGFFVLILGVSMASLSAARLIGETRAPANGPWSESPRALFAVAVIVSSMLVYGLVLRPLGFVLTTIGLLFSLLVMVGAQRPPLALLIAACMSIIIYIIFRELGVPLPPSPIELGPLGF